MTQPHKNSQFAQATMDRKPNRSNPKMYVTFDPRKCTSQRRQMFCPECQWEISWLSWPIKTDLAYKHRIFKKCAGKLTKKVWICWLSTVILSILILTVHGESTQPNLTQDLHFGGKFCGGCPHLAFFLTPLRNSSCEKLKVANDKNDSHGIHVATKK